MPPSCDDPQRQWQRIHYISFSVTSFPPHPTLRSLLCFPGWRRNGCNPPTGRSRPSGCFWLQQRWDLLYSRMMSCIPSSHCSLPLASGTDSFKIIFLFLNGFGILLAHQRFRRDQVKPNLTQAPSPLCHTAYTSVGFSLPTDISTTCPQTSVQAALTHQTSMDEIWFCPNPCFPQQKCGKCNHCKICLAWLFRISLFCHLFSALDLNLITVLARKKAAVDGEEKACPVATSFISQVLPAPLKSYMKGGGRINIRLSMPQLNPLFTSLVFVHSVTTGN